MSKNTFNLGDYLKETSVSKTDTGMEQIEYIDLDRIDPDPDNFYSLEGLDELAANIELVGLQQPLRVRPGPGDHVTVVSGHRRRAACLLIRDGGSEQFSRGVPCIVERGDASKEMQELRLIYANASTRIMTSAELSRQAERVEELLYKLKEQGVEFPGRMRDHVAAAVNASKTKLARLHAIRERLDKPLLKLFDKLTINEAVAYALSQQPVEIQRKICDQFRSTDRKIEYMTASYVSDYVDACEKFASRKCKINKGGLCINKDRILDKIFDGSYNYKPCSYGNCCATCSEYLNCRDRCPLLDEKAKAERAAKKEARKDELAAEKAQKEADLRTIEQVWARYAQALSAAGSTDAQLRRELKLPGEGYNPFDMYMDKNKVSALLDYSCTDTKQNDPLPFFYSFHVSDYSKLCRFADALGVSLDYLFLRSDEPETAEQILDNLPKAELCEAGPHWNEGIPPQAGRYFARIDMGDGGTHEAVGEYRGGSWSVFNGPLYETMKVIGWWPLPEKEATS